MPYYTRQKYTCEFCHKNTSEIVFVKINNLDYRLCTRCFLSYALHETIRDMVTSGREDDFKCALRVLEGINDLVEDNPLVQSIRFVIDEWARKYPKPLFKDELEFNWRYRFNVSKILDYLMREGILIERKSPSSNRIVIAPGDLLQDLLNRYPPLTKGFFKDVVKTITGLAVVRYLSDPTSPKLRAIYATLQAIKKCTECPSTKPYFKKKEYICKICGDKFVNKDEIKEHLIVNHKDKVAYKDVNESFSEYVEISGEEIGKKCEYDLFVEWASIYGVRIDKYLRILLTRGVILPQEGDEVVVEEGDKKYIIVDLAWIRLREYMRSIERQIVRQW